MTINFNWAVVVLGVIIAQGLLASVLLLIKPDNKTANRFLGLLVLVFSLWLCDSFFNVSGIYRTDPNFYFWPIYYSLAFGPLVYFFTKSLVRKDFVFRAVDWWHFVPVFIQAVLYIVLRLGTYPDRRWFWLEVHKPYTYNLEFNLSLISLVLYSFIAIRLVRRYQVWIRNEYSEISTINLKWLYQLFVGMAFLSVLWLGEALLRTFTAYHTGLMIITIPMGLLVLFMAVGGLLQKAIDGGDTEAPQIIKKPQEYNAALLQKVVEQMEAHQFYLDPELTLSSFAEAIGARKRLVSHCINFGLQIPFIDFVNQYRIKEFQRLVDQAAADKYSLLGLAIESGFNSKSTFNRVFKKSMGISPSEYRAKQQRSLPNSS
ncbi:MAG: AraC family transcriptional regulator [Bacteroidota bacterium]